MNEFKPVVSQLEVSQGEGREVIQLQSFTDGSHNLTIETPQGEQTVELNAGTLLALHDMVNLHLDVVVDD